jgi:Rieske Fe-S protein
LVLGVSAGLAACSDAATSTLDATTSADGAGPSPDTGEPRADASPDTPDSGVREPDAAELDAGAGPTDSGGSTDVGAPSDAEPLDATSPADAGTAADSGPAVDAGPPVPPPPGYVPLAPMTDVVLNRWTSQGAAGQAFLVGRDANGVFIYSATCTHMDCLVPPPAGPGRRSVCPCHLSAFDGQGAVLSGPARRPLTHRAAFISGGTLYVHPTMVVPSTTRTPVP